MSNNQEYDVIVIGGGASGLMSAGVAGSRGLSVLVIEKNRELGKKLSITGGGRCNILNAEEDERKLLANYGEAEKFLYSPFSQHSMKDSWKFFESRGLPLKVEARKRAFPQSEDAEDVTRLMKEYATENGASFKTKTRVQSFEMENGKITGVKTKKAIYTAKSYILATGGSSHQETGSTGDALSWLRELGHTVHNPNPNIVPLSVVDEWVHRLSGTTLSFMKITFGADLTKEQGKFSKTGAILFTHFGISGPLILNSAHEVKKLLRGGPVQATIDMYPDTEIGTLRNRVLEIFKRNLNKQLKNIVEEFVPHGMEEAFLSQLDPMLHKEQINIISKEERYAMVDRLKAMPFIIDDTMGMDRAVISDGGVDIREIDTKTMRSKKIKNLFFTGDVININRPSGGYSLQLCWTTGYVAGTHA